MPSGGSCLLGSLNLAAFVDNHGNFNFEELDEAVTYAANALNNVLDEGIALHPLEEQQKSVSDWRQIGLGIMGLADMLIKMGIEYGSEESLELCDEIGSHIINMAAFTSALLAVTNGTYKNYDYNKVSNSEFYKENIWDKVDGAIKECGLHNSQLLTIAPTGTLSTMLGISGGIEPIFANYYERTTKSLYGKDVVYKIYTPIVKQYMEEHRLDDDSQLPKYFITAQTLTPMNRILMQSIWQKHIDASISSTINLPNDTTVEEVAELYHQAWINNLKGLTIFRDGCRRAGILNTTPKEEPKQEEEKLVELKRGEVIDVQNNVIGLKRKLITGCGSLHCTAFFDPDTGELLETYLSKGSTGGCNNFMIGLSRMISLSARAGVPIDKIIDQLNSCGACPSYAARSATKHDTSRGSCCPVAVGNALKEMYNEMQDRIKGNETKNPKTYAPKEALNKVSGIGGKCPQCGNDIVHEGGCNICKSCGWSKCD